MKVLVFGTGANGLILAELAKNRGPQLLLSPGEREAVSMCLWQWGSMKRLWPTIPEKGTSVELHREVFDVIFKTTGSAPIVEEAFQYIAPGGKIIIYGIAPPDQNAQINPFDICRKDLQVIGSFSSVNSCIIAQELLANGIIRVDHFTSHRFPLLGWGKAIETSGDSVKCMRAVILMP